MLPRADQLLVQSGLARSRTEAQQLLESNQVVVRDGHGKRLQIKPSTRPNFQLKFELCGESAKFASRGGVKLQGALDSFSISVQGAKCLDAGQSTGGFTDCLLTNGASVVVGVDVGHNQLVARLRSDPRVICIERFNLRDANRQSLAIQVAKSGTAMPEPARAEIVTACQFSGFDTIVADVSFISIRKIMPALRELLGEGGKMVLLVKPQFELGPGAVNRRGIVRNPNAGIKLEQDISIAAATLGLNLRDWIASSITGGDGNQEYLAYVE